MEIEMPIMWGEAVAIDNTELPFTEHWAYTKLCASSPPIIQKIGIYSLHINERTYRLHNFKNIKGFCKL